MNGSLLHENIKLMFNKSLTKHAEVKIQLANAPNISNGNC